MATKAAVKAGSHFCRDCGGKITERGGLAWCENTTNKGDQQRRQDHCDNLVQGNRRFCEECGLPVKGVTPCNLGHTPLRP